MIPATHTPEEVRAPQPGEAFLQLGCRIVVVEVDEVNISYALPTVYPGALFTVPLAIWLNELDCGTLERAT